LIAPSVLSNVYFHWTSRHDIAEKQKKEQHTTHKINLVITSAHGTKAVPTSYKTPTKCLNNQWVTIRLPVNLKKKSNLLFHSRWKK
jgi:hypothetical protein